MIGFAVRVVALASIYLLVLTSLDPGDVLVGVVIAAGIVGLTSAHERAPVVGWGAWARALAGTLASTALEVVAGTVRTVRFALGGTAAPGFVEIPRGDRSRRAVALWGVLTGEAPDEYPVDVDDAHDVLVVHVLDARDVPAIRDRHARTRSRWQRDVVR